MFAVTALTVLGLITVSSACTNQAGNANCDAYVTASEGICDSFSKAGCASMCGTCPLSDCKDQSAGCGPYVDYMGGKCDAFSNVGCPVTCGTC